MSDSRPAIAGILPSMFVKRDGREVPFDKEKIVDAIYKAFMATGWYERAGVDSLRQVRALANYHATQALFFAEGLQTVHLEDVQNAVVAELKRKNNDVAEKYEAHMLLHAIKRGPVREILPEHKAAFDSSKLFFNTQLQEWQWYDKYSRFNYEKGRRETWPEACERVVGYYRKRIGNKIPDSTYERLYNGMVNMRVMPSMRMLSMAGPAVDRSDIAQYNCCYLPIDCLDAFHEALLISMHGCGVGFSVERRNVDQLPPVEFQNGEDPEYYYIYDSTEGWVEALKYGLKVWFSGQDVSFDYSGIRHAGTPLKTKGGRASGERPLRRLLEFARQRVLSRQGSSFSTVDAHYLMCAVGTAVLSGGVRRTAMISLFDFDDMEMFHVKDNMYVWSEEKQKMVIDPAHPEKEFLGMSNNSRCWPDRRLTQQEIMDQLARMTGAGYGEPGIFSLRAAHATMPETRKKEINGVKIQHGTNPCHRGSNIIHTTVGAVPIRDLVGKYFEVVTPAGKIVPATAYATGTGRLSRVQVRNGMTIDLTENHNLVLEDGTKISVKDLKVGDRLLLNYNSLTPFRASNNHTADEGVLVGWNAGDGWITHNKAVDRPQIGFVFGTGAEKESEWVLGKINAVTKVQHVLSVRPERGVREVQVSSQAFVSYFIDELGAVKKTIGVPQSVMQGNREYQAGYLRGLFTSDGHVEGGGDTVLRRLTLISAHETLSKQVQILLSTFGIISTLHHSISRLKGYDKDYNRWALRITGDSVETFMEKIGFIANSYKDTASAIWATKQWATFERREGACVESITDLGVEEDVYNITIDDPSHMFAVNGFISANCGEIVLRPTQFCNLSSAVARNTDTFDDLIDKVEMAAIFGTMSASFTNFPGLRESWTLNTKEEALLGVDISGFLDCPLLQDGGVQAFLRDAAIRTNREYAEMIGINTSASVTCNKPNGNTSVLLDTNPGVNPRRSRFYIRNVRLSDTSTMYKVLKASGYTLHPDPQNSTLFYASFPSKSPEGTILIEDRTVIQEMNFWLKVKQNWTTHNPSVTFNYRPEEVIDMARWTWEHQDWLGGISFLPYSNDSYPGLPYVTCTENEYNEALKECGDIDFSLLWSYEEKDYTESAMTLACVPGQEC